MDPQQDGGEAPQAPSYNHNHSFLTLGLIVLLIGALAFGIWAYTKMGQYKDVSDQKISAAVQAANKTQAAQLQAQFDQQSKSPYKTFKGSPTYGSITFDYPKTWSAYVDSGDNTQPINGYFHPDAVPGVNSKTAYALRVQLLDTDYSQVLQQFDNNIKQGLVTARAYVPPKLQGAANVPAGVYLSGQINSNDPTQKGNMVVLKVRDKTLQIYSESNDFATDFNNIVLGSLIFAP